MEKLLTDTVQIIKQFQNEEMKSGKNFNIFKIFNMNHDEVKICNFLYELLNIKGCHGQGSFFLKSFIHEVLKIDEINDDEIAIMQTFKERVTINNRRIDLCLEGLNNIIGIEVKIYANDQFEQLFDYYEDIKRFNKKIHLYYLTLNGKNASKESIKTLSENDYYCISFSQDIIPWIDNCIKKLENLPNINIILYQFNDILKNLCNINSEDINMKTKDLILSSKENLISAIKISKNLDSAKVDIIKKFMETIKNKLKDEKIEYLESYFDSNDGNINDFYTKVKYTWPSVNFKYKDKKETGSDKEVFLRLEIEDNLFIGFCVTSNGKNNFERLDNALEKEIISKHKDFKLGSPNNWWICWKHILLNNEKINFRTFNNNAIALIDENVRNDVAEKVVSEIKILLNV